MTPEAAIAAAPVPARKRRRDTARPLFATPLWACGRLRTSERNSEPDIISPCSMRRPTASSDGGGVPYVMTSSEVAEHGSREIAHAILNSTSDSPRGTCSIVRIMPRLVRWSYCKMRRTAPTQVMLKHQCLFTADFVLREIVEIDRTTLLAPYPKVPSAPARRC